MQVQQDRFAVNWRRGAEAQEYPRFKHIFRVFRRELGVFRRFLKEEGLPKLLPNQCEVTYVNHILAGTAWKEHGQLDRITPVWRIKYCDGFLSRPEESEFTVRYVIPDEVDVPLGLTAERHVNRSEQRSHARSRRAHPIDHRAKLAQTEPDLIVCRPGRGRGPA